MSEVLHLQMQEVSYEQLQDMVEKLQTECESLKKIVKSAEVLLDQDSTKCEYCSIFLRLNSNDCEYSACYGCGETLCKPCHMRSDWIKCENCDEEVCRSCAETDIRCKYCM